MQIVLTVFFVLWFVLSLLRLNTMVSLLPLGFLLYLVKFELWGIPLTVVEMMVYLSFLAYLILRIQSFRSVLRRSLDSSSTSSESLGMTINNIVKKDWFWPVLLLVAAVFLSTLMVPDRVEVWNEVVETKRQALGIVKGWVLMPLFYFWLWFSAVKADRHYWYLGMRAYLVAALVLSVSAFYQVFQGASVHYLENRASGPFTNANYLALLLGPALVFLLLYAVERIKKISKAELIFNLFALVVLALAIYFSRSYACWLAVVGVFLVYVLLKNKTWNFKKIGALFGAIFLIVVLFLTQIGTQKFERLINLKGLSSSSARMEVWTVSLALIKDHPVLGIGPGQFQAQYQLRAAEILGKMPYELKMLHPHNIFLTFWLYTGVLGLIGFVWLLGLCFWRLTKFRTPEVVIGGALLFYLVLHGLFDTPFWKNDLALQFWLIVGGILALTEKEESWWRWVMNYLRRDNS